MSDPHVCSTDHAAQAPGGPADLATLSTLSERVARVHGATDPRLIQVQAVFQSAKAAMQALQGDLAQLRSLTDAYSPPDSACRSYRGLFSGLAQLDQEGSAFLSYLGLK